MKKYIPDYVMLFLVSGSIVFFDQMTKSIVRTNVAGYGPYLPDFWLTQYARIVNVQNTGAAFGLFQQFGGLFTVLSFIVGGFILYYFPRIPRSDWLLRLALCLQFAGAVGNLLDRLVHGFVTDFISILNFPVFNIADLSITVGVALMVVVMWSRDRQKQKPESQSETAASVVSEDTQSE